MLHVARRISAAAAAAVGVVAGEAIYVRLSFQLPPDPSKKLSGVESPSSTPQSPRQSTLVQPLRHIVLMGDSLVTGVGCSLAVSEAGPVLPRSCAAVLAEGLGQGVGWTLLGETGADVMQLRDDYLPAFRRVVSRVHEEGGCIDAVVVLCGLNDVKQCCLHVQPISHHPAVFGDELEQLLLGIREAAGSQCVLLVPEEPMGDNPRFSRLWPLSACMRGVSALWDYHKQQACTRAAQAQETQEAQEGAASTTSGGSIRHLPMPWGSAPPVLENINDVYCSDGMHPNDLGYRLWGQVMGRALLDHLRHGPT